MPDRDAMGDRYVAYCEARDTPGREVEAAKLAQAVADDVAQWRDEVDRIEALRIELGAEVDRLLEENDRLRGGA
ncbi:hypothetical protein JNW90_09040 [Micromonospora sp. STR1s_5]|nr:hypothetical protein [Micromonospora sp. STR1s_5]